MPTRSVGSPNVRPPPARAPRPARARRAWPGSSPAPSARAPARARRPGAAACSLSRLKRSASSCFALGVERVGEEAGDAREVGALAALVERRVAVAQGLGRRPRRAREQLDEIGLLRVERGPEGEAGLLDRPSPVGEELPRQLDVAAHRLEHGALDGARRTDRRVVAVDARETRGSARCPLRRAAARRPHSPSARRCSRPARPDSCRGARTRAPASRRPRRSRASPSRFPRRGRRGSRPGRGCSRRPAPRRPSSASSASLAQLFAAPAEHAQRAEPEQRPRRPAAAELERLLERAPALGAVDAGGPEAPERRRQPQQQLAVARTCARTRSPRARSGTRRRRARERPGGRRCANRRRAARPRLAIQAACRSHAALELAGRLE